MNVVQNILDFLHTLLAWWFIVEPWEQAVRVRFGKHVRLFGPGTHLRLPFFDIVYKQNTRRRVSGIPLQTLTTHDGVAITVHGSLGYKVVDVLTLHMTLHDAEFSVRQEAMGLVTDFIVQHDAKQCTPAAIMEHVTERLDLSKYGLGDVDFFLTGYVSNLPTYRLIQDSMAPYNEASSLNTQIVSGTAPPR